MRKTPFKPKKGKVWKKLSPVSKKMIGGLAKYGKAKKEYLEEHEICEACHFCKANQIHHRAGRLGSLLWNKEYFFATCSACHRGITKHPGMAIVMGYSLNRLSNEI